MAAPLPPENRLLGETNPEIQSLLLRSMGAAGEAFGGTVGTQTEPPAEELDPNYEEQKRQALISMFGPDFPYAKLGNEVTDDDWSAWVRSIWSRHSAAKWRHIHMAIRNRLFRNDLQWVSSVGLGPWREPPKPREQTRAVYNLIRPALDQRIQIITEQRPGFQTRPTTTDPEDQKRAEAQQVALEYSFDAQGMPAVLREALFWAGTDGVSFLHSFWNPDTGPWHESMKQDGQPHRELLGDVSTEVLRIEEVCVSANATSSCKPHYWVIKKPMPKAYAVAIYGTQVVDSDEHDSSGDDFTPGTVMGVRLGLDVPGEHDLFEDQDIVDRYTVYCEPCEYLPDGLTVITVGNVVLWVGPLQYGVVPVARLTDGSSDPSFFPRPVMNDWVDHQIRINALISKWVDSVRQNVGGRFIARKGAVVGETFMANGSISVMEVRSQGGNLNEHVQASQPFLVGNDLKELLAIEKQAFEEKSGWSDASRGTFSGEASGRAILAARESLERIFAEPVSAACRAMVEHGKVSLHIMRWGYDDTRVVGVIGRNRTDLAYALNTDDFDGICDVTIDPETLIPLPRALRLFLLDQAFEKGVIDVKEYRRRLPFAYTRDMWTPDEDQAARAKRVVEAIKNLQPPPEVRWTDDEAIHQDVLQREILCRDDLDPRVIALGMERWNQLAMQALQKTGGMPMMPGMAGGAGQPTSKFPPQKQPLLMNNPSVASAPVGVSTGYTQSQNRTALFDRTAPY